VLENDLGPDEAPFLRFVWLILASFDDAEVTLGRIQIDVYPFEV